MSKDFLSFLDWTQSELISLMDQAEWFRAAFRSRQMPPILADRAVALLWNAEGFRNRAAFELGIQRLGGVAVEVPGDLDERESVEDVAGYLDNWFDAIIVRAKAHSHMERLAKAARIPVLNARTPYNHPCEILGDLAFVKRVRGSLDGLRVTFVGGATNLCHSWFEAAARLPIAVMQVCPKAFQIEGGSLGTLAHGAVGSLGVTDDLHAALQGADVIYTDSWPRWHSVEERTAIHREFAPYRITGEHLRLAGPRALFLPCPPVHRGEEVSDDAMESPYCRVYEAKEYLLHAQNAVLADLIG